MTLRDLRGPARWLAMAGILATPTAMAVQAQEARIASSAVTLSSGEAGRAELQLELSGGQDYSIELYDGVVRIDGREAGRYAEGGALARAWRELLRQLIGEDEGAIGGRLLAFSPEGLTGSDAASAEALREWIRDRLAPAERASAETPAAAGAGEIRIAPGGIGFEALAGSLERLQRSLEPLGEAGRAAGEALAMMVHDDFTIPADRQIEGAIALLDGELELSGDVSGDVLILDGTLVLEPGGRVAGDVLQVGGRIEQRGGEVLGEILADLPLGAARGEAVAAEVEPETPTVVRSERRDRRETRRGPVDRFTRNLGRAAEGLFGTVTAFLALAVLGVLLVYFARERLEIVSDTLRNEFGRSFAMGLAGWVLFFPALLVMMVLIITIPLIPFVIIAVGLSALAGYIAAAHGAGEIFARRRYRYEWLERMRRSNSYYYVLSGLALLLLPFALGALLWVFGGMLGALRGVVAFAACVATWILVTSGFGAVLLTRAGQRSIVVHWPGEGPGAYPGDVDPDVTPPPSEPAPRPEARTGDEDAAAEPENAGDSASGDEPPPAPGAGS